ncbi:MAG: ATP synthase subunit I [Myxococcales bacterium]|nr:ATP synthase subunit I [Myxococcales bacterium]
MATTTVEEEPKSPAPRRRRKRRAQPSTDEQAAELRKAEAESAATLRTAVLAVAGAAVVIALAVLFVWGPGAAIGVACGGALATANLYVFVRVGRGIVTGGRKARFWALVGAAKFLGLIGVVYLLLRTGVASGLGLALGYAALPLGIAIGHFLAPRPGDTERTAER